MGEAGDGRDEGRSIAVLTLILSERDAEGLLRMDEVIASVEEAFRQEGVGNATNYMRTRSRGGASVLNVMHANLSYLGRAGLKAYISTGAGVRFAVLLFDAAKADPLAVIGADMIGRFRTGAASGVATKYLYRKRSGAVAILGSGKQAFTQALAMKSVMSVDEARVWSPNPKHREGFSKKLKDAGLRVSNCASPAAALDGADVCCSITSASEPFIQGSMLTSVSHVNIAGGNVAGHAEMSAQAVGSFDTVVVDDLPQARVEYGDLIRAAEAGTLSWEAAVELSTVVAGKKEPGRRTLFKSGGVALEDVAVASMLYDRALESGTRYPNVELV